MSIKKLKKFNERFFRYYTLEYIMIDTKTSPIRKESQLAYYIYRKWGPGRYSCISWMKHHKGFFNYWLGDILDNGFIRDRSKNKEMDRLKKELTKTQSFEEREIVEEEIDLEREITSETKKTRRQGPYGLIRSAPGIIHGYEEF